jgi:hypothetical protein
VAAVALVGVVPYTGLINGNATSDTLALLPLWSLQDTITTLDEITVVVMLLALGLALLFLLVPARSALALPAAIVVLYALALWPIETNPHGGIHHASVGALFGGTSNPDREWIDHAVGANADVAVLYDAATMDKFTVWTNEFFNRSIGHVGYTTEPTPGGLPETRARSGHDGLIPGLGQPQYVLTSLPLSGQLVARDPVKNLNLWRTGEAVPRVQYRTTGIYPDNWIGRHATIERFECSNRTTVRLSQDPKLFHEPQTVIVNGHRYLVRGTRAVRVPACFVDIRVPETRVPGPEDLRELGVRIDSFE